MIPPPIEVSIISSKHSIESVFKDLAFEYLDLKNKKMSWRSTKNFFDNYLHTQSAIRKASRSDKNSSYYYEIFLLRGFLFRSSLSFLTNGAGSFGDSLEHYLGVNFYPHIQIPLREDVSTYELKDGVVQAPGSQSEHGIIEFSAKEEGIESRFKTNVVAGPSTSKYAKLVPDKKNLAYVSGIKIKIKSNDSRDVVLGDGTLDAFLKHMQVYDEIKMFVK